MIVSDAVPFSVTIGEIVSTHIIDHVILVYPEGHGVHDAEPITFAKVFAGHCTHDHHVVALNVPGEHALQLGIDPESNNS